MHLASGIDSFSSTAKASSIVLDTTYPHSHLPLTSSETAYVMMLALVGLMILIRRRHRVSPIHLARS